MSNKPVSVEAFVKETLLQISNALDGLTVNHAVIPVKFELGILATHTKTTQTSGGIGVAVATVLKAGSTGESHKDNLKTEYNRVTFTIELEVDKKRTKVTPPFSGVAI